MVRKKCGDVVMLLNDGLDSYLLDVWSWVDATLSPSFYSLSPHPVSLLILFPFPPPFRICPTKTQETRHKREHDGCHFHGQKETV